MSFEIPETCGGRSQATNVGSIPIARSTFFSVESFVSRVTTRFTHRYCRCADWAGRAWNRIVSQPSYRTAFLLIKEANSSLVEQRRERVEVLNERFSSKTCNGNLRLGFAIDKRLLDGDVARLFQLSQMDRKVAVRRFQMLFERHEVTSTGTDEIRHDPETKASMNHLVDVLNVEGHYERWLPLLLARKAYQVKSG